MSGSRSDGWRAAAVGALLFVLSAPLSAGQERDARGERGFAARWIAGRLTIGAQFTGYRLEDTRRAGEDGYDNANLSGNFLGTLWGLDTRQHWFPNPYLEYRVVWGLGIAVAYDELRARTLDWADDTHTATAGDGDLDIRGTAVSVVGRYRNHSRFEPYLGAGYAWYGSHFHVAAGWAAPGRRFEVEDTRGWLVSAGCRASLGRHVALELGFRHTHVGEVAAKAYIGVGNRHRAGAFPMRSDSLAIGAVYTF